MSNDILKTITLSLALSVSVPGANATLFDRGGGMIYDSDQDITWMQDANYTNTLGYEDIGLLKWDAAVAWADQLSFGGYNDWRLPAIVDNGNDGCNWSYNGTDCGYHIAQPGAELAYLYHYLGNVPYYDISGASTGPKGLQFSSADGVDFLNIRSSEYWSGSEVVSDREHAWHFDTYVGMQSVDQDKRELLFVWAVRDGDVATVPEPGTALLFGLGLAGLMRLRRC